MRMAYWTTPELVARVRYAGVTPDRRLRAPVFVALRDDARPEDCRVAGASRGHANSCRSTRGGRLASQTQKIAKGVTRAPELAGKVMSESSQNRSGTFTSGKQRKHCRGARRKAISSDAPSTKSTSPESGYAKRDLLAYYYQMADLILPFLKDRPLVLRRYPDGILGEAFFQKDVREGVPDWLATVAIPSESAKDGKSEIHYVIANDRA